MSDWACNSQGTGGANVTFYHLLCETAIALRRMAGAFTSLSLQLNRTPRVVLVASVFGLKLAKMCTHRFFDLAAFCNI